MPLKNLRGELKKWLISRRSPSTVVYFQIRILIGTLVKIVIFCLKSSTQCTAYRAKNWALVVADGNGGVCGDGLTVHVEDWRDIGCRHFPVA